MGHTCKIWKNNGYLFATHYFTNSTFRPIPPDATCVQVPLQNVVNHTVDRILLDLGIIEQVKELKAKYGTVQLQFIHKLGMDGSKGHPGGHHVLGILEAGTFFIK